MLEGLAGAGKRLYTFNQSVNGSAVSFLVYCLPIALLARRDAMMLRCDRAEIVA